MENNGYKPSDLGKVPNGWHVKKLGEITKVRQGLQIAISDRLKAPTATSKEYITIQSINRQHQEREYVESPSSRVTCSVDDVLMTRTGNTGIVVTNVEGAFHNNFFLIDFDREQLNSTFLVNYLRSPRVQYAILTKAGSSTIPDLNHKDFYSIEFPLAPVAEQKKIAQILSTWNTAITTTEQLLANSQQQKKALMQQLLTGKKRLLDKNGVRFSGEWKPVELGQVFDRVTAKNKGQSSNVVTISGQHGLIRQEEFFKKSVASETLDGYFLLKRDQFAYNKSYSNGYPMGAIKRLNRYEDGVVTTLYICFGLADQEKANGDYFEQYFESGLLNKSLSQIAHEGGRAHGLLNVKPADFFSLKVLLPSLAEQQKIAGVLSAADKEIKTLQQKLDCLKQEKKALMQQLLTGKRRVKLN